MSINSDEYLARLLRAKIDIGEAAKADGLDTDTRNLFLALDYSIVDLINERVASMGFTSQQDATLHAQFVASGLQDLPVFGGK